jgi:hypothetical protein
VVPSDGIPPTGRRRLRGLASVQGDRPNTNNQARELWKKNTMKNPKQILSQGLLSRSEQSSGQAGEAAKYIVILWNQKEQVVAFPNRVQHAEVFKYTKQEAPHIQLISAGFFIAAGDALWVGGESTSLDLKSRPQDTDLLKSFLVSQDRSLWDLTLLTAGGAQ